MDTDADSSKADTENDAMTTESDSVIMETDDEHKEIKALNTSKESDGENLDAIRKYIEEQEKEIQELTAQSSEKKNVEAKKVEEVKESKSSTEETMDVASSMMDMILTESEARIAKKDEDGQIKTLSTPEKGNSSMALSVGSYVEAKDFAEYWHPAEIMEVDYDEMEVLVRYENPAKRHDEWISVSSPRLRPKGSSQTVETPQMNTALAGPPQDTIVADTASEPEVKEEFKMEDKIKLTFVVGERCLARWRDNRRFMATITKDSGDGTYEIVFDDGFQWKCAVSRLCKYKDNLTVDTGSLTPSTSASSPIQHGAGPSAAPIPPVYHTHLFDPNRDYLGSKSERREMKRKLNVKELFNIGQKKRKKIPEEKPPKVVTPKKPKMIKKISLESPAETRNKAVKNDVPEAVASIIGTVNDEIVPPEEKEKLEPTDSDSVEVAEAKVNVKDQKAVKTAKVVDAPNNIPETTDEVQEADATISQIDMSTTENAMPTVENCIATAENEIETSTVKEETLDIEHNASNAEKDTISDQDVSGTVKKGDFEFLKTEDGDKVPKSMPEEEVKLEKFKIQDEVKHEEVIDKIKEVITKIEDDLNKVDSPKAEIKEEIKMEDVKEETKEKSKKLSKIKKGKKLRLLQEKKVKKQVEKVKNELEEMKRQVEEMRKQMLMKTGGGEAEGPLQMPESFLLPGEWCCKWLNGQPVGRVCELAERDEGKGGLPRRSVQVEDKRLPEGWTKHMVRRSLGHSAGKWDVVLVSPDNRRFHTKTDMRNYLENNPNEELKQYEHALMDFGVHLKLSRRMGWYTTTPGGTDDTPVVTLPAGTLNTTSPLVKRRKLSLKSRQRPIKVKVKVKGRRSKLMKPRGHEGHQPSEENLLAVGSADNNYMLVDSSEALPPSDPPLEDGYVYVGSLKVQIIENLLRCPAEGCFKNFRNNTLIKMHIKHYHRELRKMLGRTPKVADLASARALPTDVPPSKTREPDLKSIKVKIAKIPKKEEPKVEVKPELTIETPTTPVKDIEFPKQDSPKLRHALINKPLKRPKVLLPVRRAEPEFEPTEEMEVDEIISEPMQMIDIQDFEAAISTHTVTKPVTFDKSRVISEDDDWYTMNSDVETQSSFPRSGSPDSKSMDQKPVSSESNEEQQKEMDNMYTYTENGERIKIVHMKREEIINCHCGFREEDGLMVQCELCLCWQHALCHNIQKESEVPEKYTCSICLNPRRGRRSKRFLHDQDRLYEGLLPGARASEPLRRAHELSGNLLRVRDALHALQVKYHVAVKKDHPKLYLWAKDWENGDINLTQDRLNSEYSDFNIMINSIGKENMRVKVDDLNHIDMDHDRVSQRDGLPPLLGAPASPGGSRALDLPVSSAELERLARSVQEQEVPRGPQPEAAIENGPCRERLLRHIQRCQAVIDARLDSIEAQVAELESQDPSFEDDETADYFPRTKQTIQMLMRDLDTMEELGAS